MIWADFLWRALAAGIGVALVAGPLGCFIVWRRIAYFGDSLAHNALLGIMLGLVLGIDPTLGVIVVSIMVALFLGLLQRQRRVPGDTLLGILAHSGLAGSIVLLGLFETLPGDLLGYLFGDVLAVSVGDLLWIFGGGAVVLGLLAMIWRPLLLATLHEDLARAEGVPTGSLRLAFVLLIALVIAVAMKVVGVLLITALLIIPAATARNFARSPGGMAVLAAGAGVLAVCLGLGGSYLWDTPAGPSIVVAAALVFALSVPRVLAR